MSDPDTEFEEEEVYIFADFKNNLMFRNKVDDNTSVQIIGVDSDNPVAEVNGNFFKGNYDFSMGTHVFFEVEPDVHVVDPIYEKHSKTYFKYFTKTNKVLNFSRIFVEPENSSKLVGAESESHEKINRKNALRVDVTYENALKQISPSTSTNG